jgi:hypothetical protein
LSLWFVVTKFIPYVDRRVPLFFALLAAYCVLAYLVIPSLIRLFRLVIKPNHIPNYVTTSDGWPSDPVNIAIVAKNKKGLIEAMKAAGWYKADDLTFRSGLRELRSIVMNSPYPEAPLSNLYLFGQKQDIGFEIPTNRAGSARTRHHVRFWRVRDPSDRHVAAHPHLSFWQQQLHTLLNRRSDVWVGAATEEVTPLDIQWYTGRLTHGGSHNSDRERDFIIQTLKDSGRTRRVYSTDPGEEITFRGQQFRTIYVTDGSVKVVELR